MLTGHLVFPCLQTSLPYWFFSQSPFKSTICTQIQVRALFVGRPKAQQMVWGVFPLLGLSLNEEVVSGGPKEEEWEEEETGEVCHPGAQADPASAPLLLPGRPQCFPSALRTRTHIHPSQVSPSLPAASISPPVCPQLRGSVWPGWKKIPDKESWERRRGLSRAHKSLRN